MSLPEQMHTLTVPHPPYEAGKAITCVSVHDLESYEPFDFRDALPEDEAWDALRGVAVGVTKHILAMREQQLGVPKPIQNMGDIRSFIGSLGLRPYGKLSLVEELTIEGIPIRGLGATSTAHRQSFVIEKANDPAAAHWPDRIPIATRSKDTLIATSAVHESFHLAGIPDIAYFVVNPYNFKQVVGLKFSESALSKPHDETEGKFFEEGSATLCAYMYLWQRFPEIAELRGTEKRASPNGGTVDLPVRHSYWTNSYAFLAWGVERLVAASPSIWNILLASRDYGRSPTQIRDYLEQAVNQIDPQLFQMADKVDISSLDDVIPAAERIDWTVKKVLRD